MFDRFEFPIRITVIVVISAFPEFPATNKSYTDTKMFGYSDKVYREYEW